MYDEYIFHFFFFFSALHSQTFFINFVSKFIFLLWLIQLICFCQLALPQSITNKNAPLTLILPTSQRKAEFLQALRTAGKSLVYVYVSNHYIQQSVSANKILSAIYILLIVITSFHMCLGILLCTRNGDKV